MTVITLEWTVNSLRRHPAASGKALAPADAPGPLEWRTLPMAFGWIRKDRGKAKVGPLHARSGSQGDADRRGRTR